MQLTLNFKIIHLACVQFEDPVRSCRLACIFTLPFQYFHAGTTLIALLTVTTILRGTEVPTVIDDLCAT
jgi:hypothetical protein